MNFYVSISLKVKVVVLMESEDEYLKVKNLPNLLDREKDVIKLVLSHYLN
jgi:hypothetical protein